MFTMFADSFKDHPYSWMLNDVPDKHVQNEHKQRNMMRMFAKILSPALWQSMIDFGNYHFYYFSGMECKYIKDTLRFFRHGLSLIDEMLNVKTIRKCCRNFQKILTRFQTKLRQSNTHTLSFGIIYSGPDLTSIPDDLKTYSYLWKKLSLFKGFEKRSVVRSNRNIVMIVRHFMMKFLHSLLQRVHKYIFHRLVYDDMRYLQIKVKRFKMYFNVTHLLLDSDKIFISAAEVNKYRFINRLKGFADKKPRSLLSGAKVTMRSINVETVYDTDP